MELNQTPIRTSKNYNINSIKINSTFFNDENNFNYNKFTKININSNDNFILNNTVDKNIENYLSDEIKNQLLNNSNYEANFSFYKNAVFPTILEFNLDENNNSLIDVININIDEKINSKIIIKIISKNNVYHNGLLKINLKEESCAEIIVIYDIGENSENYNSIESVVEKNAKLILNIIDFACKNSINCYNSKLIGENSISNINSLYLGDGNSVIDLNYLSQIFAPNSKTNMEVVGTLSGNARKHFKGTIDFKKGCKKSIGNENEFCMMLSKTAKSKALPMLLCAEEDVDGKHSASVGKVDEKQLFYIMSRGVPYNDALKLIVKAKLNNVINKIFDEELKNQILDKIDGKIK